MCMVERGLQNRQYPICGRTAPADALRAIIRPVLLFRAVLGAEPCWGLGDLLMPFDKARLAQLC